MSYKTLINCTIITMEESSKFFPDGMIIIRDNIIESISKTNISDTKGEIFDMSGKIVLPGFINTHTHTHSPLFRGIADDLYLMDWLKNYMWPAERFITAEDAYNATKLSCLELTEAGITTYADQFYYSESIANAAIESGLRAFIAPTVFTNPSPETDNTFEEARKFIEKHINKSEETLIYPCIGPHAIYSCNKNTLVDVRDLALEHDLIVHIHISETIDENDDCFKNTGMSPTQYLNKLGVLKCKTLAAHSIHIDEEDRKIYRDNNVKVSYNPVSNLKLVSGYLNYKELKDSDIDISLALDGVQSNNSFDILSDLKTGILIQKMKYNDPTLLSAYDALKLITIEAAKCLYMEDKIGSIKVGKFADLTIIDTSRANMNPLHLESFNMVTSAIVYSANSADVSDVIVNGEFIYKDRISLKLSRDKVYSECAKSSKRILSSISYFSEKI
ncbi:amidohydrolase [Mycoplasmatota bacterium]|nr:amidohydrolase [Mycoplasmatota bacterium]